ncbi:MAG: biotin carboxylase N-terminal domain-containing protein [Jatrophihabitans sp.]|uniref:biotin carboxylase N-terminal domain-containing protein n=1 Tax=Jatrophihabitans sp. TaxID=1932789 RepID=UPI003F7D0AAA
MFESVLVANRGEIACRVIRTLRSLGIRSIAVHSAADAGAKHVREADEAYPLSGPNPGAGYLDIDAIVAAVRATGAEAVHPGYGFLSEHAAFARRVTAAGAVFVGPSADCIDAMGDKINARRIVGEAGVPIGRGTSTAVPDIDAARAAAHRIGYPVMVKAAGGGGGIGMGIEETPAPGLSEDVRAAMHAASVRVGEAVGYRGAGAVEWLVDPADGSFVFLEMNTRLQVEHTVTELVTGLDLVAEQLRVAAGEPPGFDPLRPPRPDGNAIQLRVCAEDPVRFLPGPGCIEQWEPPEGVRVDAGVDEGDVVTPYYDSLLAKVCVRAPDRPSAVARSRAAVEAFRLRGPRHNLPFLAEVLADPGFAAGEYDTGLVARLRPEGVG